MTRALCSLLSLFLALQTARLAVAQAPPRATEPTRGKVLLLDNDRILEGDIEKINGQYRIRRTIGELWIPADRSKRLCADLDDCYDVMKRQINLKDPDERLRLARWCQVNGLQTHALHEAKVALEMRPEHGDSAKMVQMLQRFAISASPALANPTPPQQTGKSANAGRVPLDVSSEAFALFSTRVQPILMNTCVACHSHGKGGGFQLVRANGISSRTATQANLNSALEYINAEKPVLSPLLIKAVVAHGGASAAPVKGRQSAPFQSMQSWVDQLLAGNPHLKEMRHAEIPQSSTSARKDYPSEVFLPERPQIAPSSGAPMRDPNADPKKTGEVVSRPFPRIDETSPSLPPATSPPIASRPAATPPDVAPSPTAPRDPFDPAEFNSRPK